MNRRRSVARWVPLSVAAMLLAAAAVFSTEQARGEYPHYLFVNPSYAGYGQPGPVQSYAYGWFGVCPRQMWTWHWDYYGNRWIWR